MASNLTASERETIVEIMCKMIKHPALFYAYDCNSDTKIKRWTMLKFYYDLNTAIKNIAEGGEIKFPESTAMFGLSEYIAYELPEGGVKALRRLGYKADDLDHIIHPDGKHIYHESDQLIYLAYKLKQNKVQV